MRHNTSLGIIEKALRSGELDDFFDWIERGWSDTNPIKKIRRDHADQ